MKEKIAMLRIVLPLWLLMLSFNQIAIAQQTSMHHKCATEEPTVKDLKKFQAIYGAEKSGLGNCNFTGDGGPFEIPVVIHQIEDLMDGSGENCNEPDQYNKDDAQCTLDELNAAFPIPGVSFRLADYDVNGNPISGITMRRSPFTNNASRLNRSPEIARFPPDQYLNIWLVNRINVHNSAGIASFPGTGNGGLSMAKFAMPCYGDTAPEPRLATTLIHEIGHWLGLRHIWGGNNTPGLVDNCGIDDSDFVAGYLNANFQVCSGFDITADDTPQTMGFDFDAAEDCFDYDPCLDAMGDPLMPLPLMDNYMDYTCDNNHFTDWQIGVMSSVLCNPLATFGRAELMLSTPFCDAPSAPITCDQAFLIPLESQFFETSSNEGFIGNAIVIQLKNTEITNPTSFTVSTDNLLVNAEAEYFVGQNCDYVVVRLHQIIDLDADIFFNLTINANFTNPVDPDIPFQVVAIAESNCAIEHTDLIPNPTVQTSGNGSTFFDIPFLEELARFEINSIDGFSLNVNNSTFGISVTDQTVNVGDVIDASLNWGATTAEFTLEQQDLYYIPFRIQSSCSTFYYGWLRLYVPFDCDSELRVLDAGIQTQYGLPILAGQTQCGCDCERTIIQTNHTFDQLPTNEGDFESVRFLVESIGCPPSGNQFPLGHWEYGPGTTLSVSEFTPTASTTPRDQLIINIKPNAVDGPFNIEVSFSEIGNQDCIVPSAVFNVGSWFYPEESTCVPVNQQITETTLVTVNATEEGVAPIFFELIRDGFAWQINDRSSFNLDMATPEILNAPDLTFNHDTPIDINTPYEIISGELPEGDYFIPFIMDWACGDSRLAYLRFNMDCWGNLYLLDFVYANNPYFTVMTTGHMSCAAPNDIDVWPVTTFTANLLADEVCFTANDIYEHNFQYREVGGAWINVDPDTDCVPNTSLDNCQEYEYRMQYICYPYDPIWSDEFNDPMLPDLYQTFGISSCQPVGAPTVNFEDNDVTISYHPTNVPSTASYAIEVSFEGNIVYEDVNSTGDFYFEVDECGEFTFTIIVECCADVFSDSIVSSFLIEDEPFCCTIFACQSVIVPAAGEDWTITDIDGNDYDFSAGPPCENQDFDDVITDIILDNADCGTEELNVCVNETSDGCILTITNSPIDFVTIEGAALYDFENDAEECDCNCEWPDEYNIASIVDCDNTFLILFPNQLGDLTHRWRYRIFGTTAWTITNPTTDMFTYLQGIPECGAMEIELQFQCDDPLGTWSEWANNQLIHGRPNPSVSSTIELECLNSQVVITAGEPGECQEIQWSSGTNPSSPWLAFTGVQQFIVSDFTDGEVFCASVRKYCPDGTNDCPSNGRSSCNTTVCFTPECESSPPPGESECCNYVFLTDKTMNEEDTEMMNCSLEATMDEINEDCPGCDSKFAVVGFGGKKEVNLDHPLSCEPPTLGEEEWEPTSGEADVAYVIGLMAGWLDRNLGGAVEEETCLKIVIMTNATCDEFGGNTKIDGQTYSAAEAAQILEERFAASISIVHYNEYDDNGNLINNLGECGHTDGIVTEDTGVFEEKDHDCESFADSWSETEMALVDNFGFTVDEQLTHAIYPNPFNQDLNIAIKAERSGAASLKLFNSIGQQVWHGNFQLNKGANSFSLSPKLPVGAYYFKLEFNGEYKSGKLLRME